MLWLKITANIPTFNRFSAPVNRILHSLMAFANFMRFLRSFIIFLAWNFTTSAYFKWFLCNLWVKNRLFEGETKTAVSHVRLPVSHAPNANEQRSVLKIFERLTFQSPHDKLLQRFEAFDFFAHFMCCLDHYHDPLNDELRAHSNNKRKYSHTTKWNNPKHTNYHSYSILF